MTIDPSRPPAGPTPTATATAKPTATAKDEPGTSTPQANPQANPQADPQDDPQAAPALLILDDEPAILDLILLSLAPGDWQMGRAAAQAPCVVTATRGHFAGTRFLVAGTAADALALADAAFARGERLAGGFFDLQLAAEGLQGLDVMQRLRERQPGLLCTVITGLQGEIERVSAVFAPDHLDEWDFVSKPFTRSEMVQRCRQMIAASARRLRETSQLQEIQRLNRELEAWGRSLEARVERRTEQLFRAMEELRVKNDELESVLHALHETQAELVQQEKMATIGQLASGVARELSRPLAFSEAAISGASEALARLAEYADRVEAEARPRPEASPEAVAVRAAFAEAHRALRPASAGVEGGTLLEHAAEGLQRASGIVRELASFASASGGERRRLDVARTLASAADLVRGGLDREEALGMDIDELPELEGSSAELQHAWLQLLRNAVDATASRPDGVVRLTARQSGGEIVVEVSDNGDGIPKDLRERVFEPFFSTRGRRPGLGLAVVHGVVARHGGTVEIADGDPCGTVVRVRLPAAAPACIVASRA